MKCMVEYGMYELIFEMSINPNLSTN